MNNLLYNQAFLQKLFIGFFAILILVIAVLAYFAFQQDRTKDIDFNSVTINSDAIPLTVPDYAGWVCNGFDVGVPEGSTYSQLKQQFQSTLDDWRTRRPPQELLAHYNNEKNRLIEILSVFEGDDYKKYENQIMIDETDYAIIVATHWKWKNNEYALKRNAIAKDIPQDIRNQLADLNCSIF